MKKMLAGLLLLVSSVVLAEPSFNDIQSLIEQRQYSAAEAGLVEIIKNHPQSAKAYYTMAQAQAGLGNLEKARYALDRAQGLEPSLSFADSSAVRNLRQAITPQTSKIDAVPESNFWTYFFILVGIGLLYFVYRWYQEGKEVDGTSGATPNKPSPRTPSPSTGTTSSSYSSKSRTNYRSSTTTTETVSQPQVVNHYHNDNSGDLLTGVLLGEALANNSHSHDTVIVQQAPVYVEAPAAREEYYTPSRQSAPVSSSWDNDDYSSSTKSPSVSSSWDNDDDSSSKSSSSWGSSSSSSSSWDSGSSSSSSWDSSSSSDSSSSWD